MAGFTASLRHYNPALAWGCHHTIAAFFGQTTCRFSAHPFDAYTGGRDGPVSPFTCRLASDGSTSFGAGELSPLGQGFICGAIWSPVGHRKI